MRALPILVMALLCGGCGGDRMYYQTRYIPTSADTIYSPSARTGWQGDREVYELPANPPAIDDLHRARVCERPGPRFKSTAVVGHGVEQRGGQGVVDGLMVANYDSRPQPVSARGPLKGHRTFGSHDETPVGAKEPIRPYPVGAYDRRPASTTGAGTDTSEANVLNRYRDDELYWCDPTGKRHLR